MITLKSLKFIVVIFILLSCQESECLDNNCNLKHILVVDTGCLPSETCNEAKGVCECKVEYIRVKDECLRNETKTINATIITHNEESKSGFEWKILLFVSIPIGFLLLILYFTYKYRIVSWVQTKIHQRQSNYDEVMIGQDDDDDPPLGGERA